MRTNIRSIPFTLAFLLLATAAAPLPARAWPFGSRPHLHPGPHAQDARITVNLFNKSDRFQEVSVDGQIYTVMPHEALTIKAPDGTKILANTASVYHQKGDLIFSVSKSLKGCTVSFQ